MEVEARGRIIARNRIATLFVGESAPYSGAFFYYGNSAMTLSASTSAVCIWARRCPYW